MSSPPLSDSCLWQYLVEDDLTASQPPLTDSVLWQYLVEPEETVTAPKKTEKMVKSKKIEVSSNTTSTYPLNGSFYDQSMAEVKEMREPRPAKSQPVEVPSFNRVFVRGFPKQYTVPQRKASLRDILAGTQFVNNSNWQLVRSIDAQSSRGCRGKATITFRQRIASVEFAILDGIFKKKGLCRDNDGTSFQLSFVVDTNSEKNKKIDQKNEKQEAAAELAHTVKCHKRQAARKDQYRADKQVQKLNRWELSFRTKRIRQRFPTSTNQAVEQTRDVEITVGRVHSPEPEAVLGNESPDEGAVFSDPDSEDEE